MKVIGRNQKQSIVIVSMTETDWEYLERACEMPHEKRSPEPGAEAPALVIYNTIETLAGCKGLRKELGNIQKKWDSLAARLDTILEK